MPVEHEVPGGVTVETRPEDVRVVAVDTRKERRQVIRQVLEVSFPPGQIVEADSRTGAMEAVDRFRPEVVVLEIQMPLAEGLDTITELSLVTPRPRIVVCSFLRDASAMQAAKERGADVYLTKPASATQLRAAVGPLTALEEAGHRRGRTDPPDEPVMEGCGVIA